jgi:hypothetical protein
VNGYNVEWLTYSNVKSFRLTAPGAKYRATLQRDGSFHVTNERHRRGTAPVRLGIFNGNLELLPQEYILATDGTLEKLVAKQMHQIYESLRVSGFHNCDPL